MRLDLATEWRSRRWRRLLNVIDHLPRNSHYVEAVSLDEQVAERILNMPDDSVSRPRRRMSEYSVVVETLSLLTDRVSELIGTVAASKGLKPRKIPPAPRPETATERLRSQRRRVTHRRLVSKLLPHKATEPEPVAAPPARRALPAKTPPAEGRDLLGRSGWNGSQ
jgi:hypothetical protein